MPARAKPNVGVGGRLQLTYVKPSMSDSGVKGWITASSTSIPFSVKSNSVDISGSGNEDIQGGDAFDNIDDYINDKPTAKQKSVGIKMLTPTVSLMDLRYVCYTVFNIPTENQHIEVKMRRRNIPELTQMLNKEGVMVDYAIVSNNVDYEYSTYISNTMTAIDIMDGTPVDYELYVNRDAYSVKSRSDIYIDTADIEHVEVYNVIDFVYNTARMIRSITDDHEQLNVFYHGFVEKYFPMIPVSATTSLLSTGSIYSVYSHLKYGLSRLSSRFSNELELIHQSKKSISKFEPQSVNYDRVMFKQRMLDVVNIPSPQHFKHVFDKFRLSGAVISSELWIHGRGFKKVNTYGGVVDKQSVRFLTEQGEAHTLSFVVLHPDGLNSIIRIDSTGDITYDISIAVSDISVFYEFLLTECKSVVLHMNDLLKHSDIQFTPPNKSIVRVYATSMEYIFPHGMTPTLFNNLLSNISKYTTLEQWSLHSVDSVRQIIYLSPRITQQSTQAIYNNDFLYRLNKKEFNSWRFDSVSLIEIASRSVDFVVKIPLINVETIHMLKSMLMLVIFETLASTSTKEILKLEDLTSGKYSKIRVLKENDPVLFNLDKNGKYSRKCQGEQQPILIPKSKLTGNYLKYWNFTKGRPEYYGCDSKRYPFVKFLSDVHPKNYCLPCCKKRAVGDTKYESQYVKKHEKCMASIPSSSRDSRKVIVVKKQIAPLSSRYVSNYNASIPVDVDRLMHASNSMNKLIPCPEGCKPLIILGVSQMYNKIRCPILNIVSIVDGISVDTLVNGIGVWIKKHATEFDYYDIPMFTSANQFADWLVRLTVNDGVDIITHNTDWNRTFTTILQHMGYPIVELYENGDMLSLHIQHHTDIGSLTYGDGSVVVVRRFINDTEFIYPVFRIDNNAYFSRKFIHAKTFTASEMDNVSDMCETYISRTHEDSMSSTVVLDYIKQSGQDVLDTHVDKRGLLYALTIVGKHNGKPECVNIGVEHSRVSIDMLTKEELAKKYNMSVSKLSNMRCDLVSIIRFVGAYNRFLSKQDGKQITITKLISFDGMVEACMIGSHMCRHTMIDEVSALKLTKLSNKDVWRIPVSIDHVEKQIGSTKLPSTPKIPHHKWDLYASMYETNLYSMLTMYLSDIVANIRDTKRRSALVKAIESVKSITSGIEMINTEYPTVYPILRKVWGKAGTLKMWKTISIEMIHNTRLDMDDEYLSTIIKNKGIAEKVIMTELSKKVVIANINTMPHSNGYSDIKPQAFTTCDDIRESYYCSKRKLIISKTDFNTFVPILANDMVNPFKRLYLRNLRLNNGSLDMANIEFDNNIGEEIYVH